MVAVRIAIGHLNHEVTIFSPLRTTLEDCRPIYFELGQGVLELHRGRFTEVSGMIEAAEQEGVTLMSPTVQKANPRAIRLYRSVGFRIVREQTRPANTWFPAEPEYYMERPT